MNLLIQWLLAFERSDIIRDSERKIQFLIVSLIEIAWMLAAVSLSTMAHAWRGLQDLRLEVLCCTMLLENGAKESDRSSMLCCLRKVLISSLLIL